VPSTAGSKPPKADGGATARVSIRLGAADYAARHGVFDTVG